MGLGCIGFRAYDSSIVEGSLLRVQGFRKPAKILLWALGLGFRVFGFRGLGFRSLGV